MDYLVLTDLKMEMGTTYNFYRLEILGVNMNGVEIGVINLNFGLKNSKRK